MKPVDRLLAPLTIASVLAFLAAPVEAAPPWEKITIFQRIEADPDETYPISEAQGPWIIMCASFAGDEAEEQAKELVHELRTRYKLRAYTHEVDFDFTKDSKGDGQQFHQRKRRYRVEKMKEIAVMVGDFSAVDDPQAQKILQKIRTAKPDCLDTDKRLKEGKGEYRTLANLRRMQQEIHRMVGLKQEPRGPMGHAFVTTNPLLPDDYFVPKGIDPVVLEMNEPVKYSLLDCPGRYSCKVATFTGAVLIDQKLIEEVEKKGKKLPSRLEDAAIKAHELTMALRAKGYEAYEFHDRYASMVTVGSFNAVGTPRTDGQIELDPRLHALMETFSAPKTFAPGQAAPKVGAPKTLVGIAFDVQAMPVQVPRRAISRAYDRPLFSAK